MLLSTVYIPEGRGPGIFPHADKVVHVGMYSMLSITWLWEKHRWQPAGPKALMLIAGLIFFFGVAMEGVQKLLPYRSFAADDLVANALGIGGGISLYMAIYRRQSNEKK